MTTLTFSQALQIALRDMRASGSWDARTLDRVVEIVGQCGQRRCRRCGDAIGADEEIDGCRDPNCPEQQP